jgi:hypothetical protein
MGRVKLDRRAGRRIDACHETVRFEAATFAPLPRLAAQVQMLARVRKHPDRRSIST